MNISPSSVEYGLAKAALRWRIKIAVDKDVTGAFQDMCVIIHSTKERVAVFKRLILYGKGRISSTR